MFFYYQKTTLGHWAAYKAPDRPSEKGFEGVKYKLRQITQLPQHHEDLPLNVLEDMYPLMEGT